MEMPGLYGPYACHERVLQRIWAEGEFDLNQARTTDGRRIEVMQHGRWNRLGGPDFLGAVLRIGGEVRAGDIEVHFHAEDWVAHGHASDRAYGNVVLHVVLFPPREGAPAPRRVDGGAVPTLVLLPLLLRDMEEIASDDALRRMSEQRTHPGLASLRQLSPEECAARLREKARARWRMKTHFARQRIARLGWEAAAHHTALEILGYAANRAPMLSIAVRHPIAEWRASLDPDAVHGEWFGQWKFQGLRPANYPRERLRQYARWNLKSPHWPERLAGFAAKVPPSADAPDVAGFRKAAKLSALRRRMAVELAGGEIGGTRFDTLVCDGFLPLCAAKTNADLFALWFCWPLGDVPISVRSGLRQLGVCGRPGQPFAHGWAQGLLGTET
jgi:hypothetical protein